MIDAALGCRGRDDVLIHVEVAELLSDPPPDLIARRHCRVRDTQDAAPHVHDAKAQRRWKSSGVRSWARATRPQPLLDALKAYCEHRCQDSCGSFSRAQSSPTSVGLSSKLRVGGFLLFNGALSTYEKLGFVRDRKIGKHR